VLWRSFCASRETSCWREDAPGAAAFAEDLFRRSIGFARAQSALSWELRSATDLAPAATRSKFAAAKRAKRLASVYGLFAEGYGTADLKAAKSLLDEFDDARPRRRENSGAAGFAKINATAIEAAPPSSPWYVSAPTFAARVPIRPLAAFTFGASLAAGRAAALVFGRTASVRLRAALAFGASLSAGPAAVLVFGS